MTVRNALVAGVIGLGVLTAAGCGAANRNDTSESAGDAVKKDGGTLVFAVNSLPDNLTSVPWGGVASHTVLNGLTSHLVRYDSSSLPGGGCEQPPNGANIVPYIAESIELAPDGTKVTLKLKDLKSPYGNTLSAEDVKFSLERELDIDPVSKDGFVDAGYDAENLVTIVDPKTVELNVKKPTSYTTELLVNNIQTIYDSTEALKHATAKDKWANDWLNTNLADYSGWELESYTPGSDLILKANPNWGGERGNISRMVVRAVPQAATREQLITTGEAQIVNGLEYDQYAKLGDSPGVRVIHCNGYTRDLLILQSKTKPLDNPKVRQAISMAIDRDTLAKAAYSGFAKGSLTPYPSAAGAEPTNPYTFDPAAAKQLLAEAGFPNGFDLTITFSPSRPGPVVRKSSVLLQSMLGDVGIKVKLREIASPTDFYTAYSEKQYQAILYSDPPPVTDPAFYGRVWFHSEAPNNTSGFASQEYDDLLVKLKTTPLDQLDERKALLTQMAQIVNEDSSTLGLVEPANLAAATDQVSPFITTPNGYIRFHELSVQ
jgi:peptide/nickel transport system substrate-binding protein